MNSLMSNMKNYKLLYGFNDPLGAPDSKAGISGHFEVRLGVYQNSYSRNSHVACFDICYIGPARAIENLEKAIKQSFDWSIERDGRGHSEWISGHTAEMLEIEIDKIIEGYKFKVQKVDKKFLPLTVDNMQEFRQYYGLE
jgi:hypothetical protein